MYKYTYIYMISTLAAATRLKRGRDPLTRSET